MILNSDSDATGVKARKDMKRYSKRTKTVSEREIQRVEKERKALMAIQTVYPQCAKCRHHFKSQHFLEQHVCSGLMECRDVLSIAMRHANQLLINMDFSIAGAIENVSNMLEPEMRQTTFESNFYTGWAHARKCMQPDLTSKVISIIHECWKVGESKDCGKVKISADGVFARLEELQQQKVLRLSEVPVVGKIRGMYQSIGNKSQAQLATGSKRRRYEGEGPSTRCERQKKARVTLEELDLKKNPSLWKKELEAYLSHHHIRKTGNKPELVSRVLEHMKTTIHNFSL